MEDDPGRGRRDGEEPSALPEKELSGRARAAEEELAHQRELFHKLLDTVPVMIAVYDPRLRHFEFNRELKRTLGWTEEDARDPALMERLYPDPELREEVVRFMKSLEPGWRDFVVMAKDGTPVESSWANVRLTDRTHIGIGVDIRERKRRENELARLNARLAEHVARRAGELQHSIIQLEEESARRERAEQSLRDRGLVLEAFFEHTPSPLAFLDTGFRVIRVNQAFADAMGLDRQRAVGRGYFEVCPGNLERARFEEALETGRPQWGHAERFDHPRRDDGGSTYWNWRVVPLADDEGLVWQLVLTLDDVTEETRAREELQAANAELSRLTDQLRSLTMELAQAEDRERKRLSEILHDELQQLLTGARYQLGALARQAGADSPSAEALQRVEELIETSAAKARALSHELRPAVLEQADLGPALEWLAADLEEKHGLKTRVEVRGEKKPELAAGIKVFLFKAARELLFNVVKHSGGSDAWVMLRKSSDRIELSVRDEGEGFSPQSLGEPGRAGTGFGLFGIRERLRLLGGSMNVESAPGRGVIVELLLPRGPVRATERSAPRGEELAPVEEAAGGPAAPATGAGPIRVLLADDHPDARRGLEALLAEHDDVEVVGEAENGREVIELARRLKPDVILMDLSMPILDGISATEAIKQEQPGMRVVGLSMYGDTDLARRMVGAGAETCLSKTDDPDTILEALRGGPEGPAS